MKHLIALTLLFLSATLNAQYVLKGEITDQNNVPIPGVKVYVDSTTYGVITDYNGAYFLELKTLGNYAIQYKMIGMEDTTVLVALQEKITSVNVQLKEKTVELGSVEVVTKKIKVANSIIKKVQKNKKNMALQVNNYVCRTYLKTGLEREQRKPDSTAEGPSKMSLIESLSITTFIAPGTYHEKVIAHHDYSDKVPSRTGSPIDYFQDDIITPIQAVEVDPYIFYEKVEDGDFNLYQNMINLPKIAEHPITSPLGVQAFTNYKFQLTNILFEAGQKIYEIEVTPRFKSAALVSGQLYIINELWVVKSFNLSVNSDAMPFFKTFNVIQDYEKIDEQWMPVRREFTYTIKEEEHYIRANTRVNHSGFEFNLAISAKDFKNEISSYSDDAFNRDSAFWNNNRPLQLKQSELRFIVEQERIDSVRLSEHYLDSVDSEFNKIKFLDIALNGVGFRNRFKKQEIFLAPILGSFELFGIGGFRYNFKGSYTKQFENAHKIKIAPSLNYGFRNNDLKPQLSVDYTFQPLKFGSVEFEIGDIYQRVTNQTTAANFILGGGNMVENTFISLAHRRELVNGLYGRVKFSYADMRPLGEVDLGPIIDYFKSLDTMELQLFPEPPPFEPYRISLLEIKLQYRFKQKYIIKNNEKLIIGSEYPEIEMTFKQGIPNLFGSDISFNSLEFKVSDEINFGNYGDSRWKVIAGSFLYKNDLRVIEHRFFKESDQVLFSNPLNTHQSLDTNYNTSGAYLQAFYLHHFNGFFLNKIPLIRKLKFESIAGASIMLLDEFDYSHSEFFVGIEKKVKILNQYFKYGFYYVGRFNDVTNPQLRFKIGIDFLNTFTNKWSW
ncbi:MAG: hypothetical protein ACI8ZM_002560 [Crocinitomix sp.]|jgi:hypothetical protein